jgi:hypothetical protein
VSRVLGGDYIRSAVKRAGLSGITWHSLRRYHASTLLSAGVSPALVAERLGHDVQTLMRTYAPRGVPFIGPELRKSSGFTSTPRSERGDSATCGDDPKSPLTRYVASRPSSSFLDDSQDSED